jgi:tRNA-dihydrouridine synthase B
MPSATLPASVFLAPMAGITDKAYRVFMSQLGAPVVMTELISSEGFVHGSKRTREMLEIDTEEAPCGVQIFGHRPEALQQIAHYSEKNGASFVDLNFGCPVNKVTKCGAGSGALKNLPFMRELIRATRDAISIPLSIKIRSGWDDEHVVAQEVCHMAQEEGVNWVSLHARTREQGYRGPNNWKLIQECHQQKTIPIIGNGEIKTTQEASHWLTEDNCSGVMIGRAALVNPLIFRELQPSLEHPTIPKPKTITCRELIARFTKAAEQHCHPKVQLVKIKKVAAWLSIGHPMSVEFRSHLMRDIQQTSALLQACDEFFKAHTTPIPPTDLSFLKGGHG